MFIRKSVYLGVVVKDIKNKNKVRDALINHLYNELNKMLPHIYTYAYNRSPSNYNLEESIYREIDKYLSYMLDIVTDNNRIVEIDIVDTYLRGKLAIIELSIWEEKRNGKTRTKNR